MRNKYFSFSTGNVMFDFADYYYDFPDISIDSDICIAHGNDNVWDFYYV